MSGEEDPYRYTDIGGGVNPFGESIESLSKVEDTIEGISAKFEGLAKSLEVITSKLDKGFKPVAKELNKPKMVKATKKLTGMFKALAGGGPQAMAVQLLMEALKPLLALFKPFQVILDIISALISVMVAKALAPMFEALQPLYDAFLSLMPVFAELGGKIGELIATLLVPFVAILLALFPVIEPIIGIIIELIAMAIEPLKTIFEALMPVIMLIMSTIMTFITSAMDPLKEVFFALVPVLFPIIGLITLLALVLEPLMSVFNELIPVIQPIINTIISFIVSAMDPLMGVFITLIPVLFPIIGLITLLTSGLGSLAPALSLIAGGFIWLVNQIINAVNFIMNTLTLGLWADIGTLAIPSLQEGGIALSHGLYELGEGGKPEMVIPLDEWRKGQSQQTALLSSMHDELIVLNYHNSKIVGLKEWKRVFE